MQLTSGRTPIEVFIPVVWRRLLTGSRAPSRRRAQRALDSATVLDQVVERQLPLVAQLPEAKRARAGDFLAELVLLATAYRHYAAGWLTRRELEHRGLCTMQRLARLRSRSAPADQLDRAGPAVRFTEPD